MKHCIIFLALIVFAASANADSYGQDWLYSPLHNDSRPDWRLLDQMQRDTEAYQRQQLIDMQRRRLILEQHRRDNPPSCYQRGPYLECF